MYVTLTQCQPGPIMSQTVQVTAHNEVFVLDKPLQPSSILPYLPMNLEEANHDEVITIDDLIPADVPRSTVCQDACVSSSSCCMLSPLAQIFTPLFFPPGSDSVYPLYSILYTVAITV